MLMLGNIIQDSELIVLKAIKKYWINKVNIICRWELYFYEYAIENL